MVNTKYDPIFLNNSYFPKEILENHIFPFCQFPVAIKCRLVCKDWKHIIDDYFFKLLNQKFKERVQEVNTTKTVLQVLNDIYRIHQNIRSRRYEMTYLTDLMDEGPHSRNVSLKIYKSKLLAIDRVRFMVWNLETSKSEIILKNWSRSQKIEVEEDHAFIVPIGSVLKKINLNTGDVKDIDVGGSESIDIIKVYGMKLISGSNKGVCKIRDINTGACLKELKEHDNPIFCIDVADGFIAAGSYTLGDCKHYKITCWDLSGKVCYTQEGEGTVDVVKIKDRKLFTNAGPYSCQIIDLESGIAQKINAFIGSCCCLEFFEDKIIIGGDLACIIWNPNENKSQALNKYKGIIKALKVFDRKLFIGFNDSNCSVWDLDTMECLCTFAEHNFGSFDWISSVEYCDGKLISASHDGSIVIRNFRSTSSLKKLDPYLLIKDLKDTLKSDHEGEDFKKKLHPLILQFRMLEADIKKRVISFCYHEYMMERPPEIQVPLEMDKSMFSEFYSAFCDEERKKDVDNIFASALDKFLNSK
jgi:WD40 repeat protein